MLQRCLILGLICAVFLSLSAPASAARVTDGSGQPQSSTGNSSVTIPSDGTISFEQIGPRVKANNLTLKAAQENLKSAEAMDWDEAIGEMEDAIDELEDQIDLVLSSSASQAAMAAQSIQAAIGAIETSKGIISDPTSFVQNIVAASSLTALSQYSKMQVASLEASLDSMEKQLDDLHEQKEEYQKTLEDTAHQIDYATAQTTAGAESLYLTILSTQLQLDALMDTHDSTKRTLDEIQLRYNLGQVSQLTLLQAQNGYDSVQTSITSLETSVSSLSRSLQSLMGDPPTGQLTLTNTPSVTDRELSSLSYFRDLTRAKEKSYTIYASARSVESAEEKMKDALREEGKNSYQYKMAEYAYQAALYQDQATVAEFELSFQNLYKAIPPAQAAVATREKDLAYEEQIYAVAEKKHQLGLLSDNALLDAQITLKTAKRDVMAAKLDLFTAYHSYNQAVTQGLVSSGV